MITYDRVKHLFDYNDGELIWKNPTSKRVKKGSVAGFDNSNGYKRIGIDGSKYYVHRIVYLWHNGHMPNIVDHANHKTDDNRIESLRAATRTQNNANRIKTKGTSIYKGVSWAKRMNKWHAQISIKNKTKSIGHYKSEKSAARAYNIAARSLWGEFAVLNEVTL